jgi:hypothetical protein
MAAAAAAAAAEDTRILLRLFFHTIPHRQLKRIRTAKEKKILYSRKERKSFYTQKLSILKFNDLFN